MHNSSKRPRWSHHLQNSFSNGEYYESPTTRAKTKVFRSLCLGNKINTNNAFDIDMIGYFKLWLEQEKLSSNSSKNDIGTFQEISDFLEASAKIYGYRIDNIRETTGKLMDGIKVVQEDMAEDDEPIINPKSKRLRLMLTTTDKLNRRSVELGHFTNQEIKRLFSNFKLRDAFKTGCPRDYMSKLFNNVFENEYKLKNTKERYDEKKSTIQISNITNQIMCEEALLCSEFSDLEYELKKNKKVKKRDKMELDGIEVQFVPSLYPSPTSYTSNEVDYQENDNFDAYSNNEDKPAIDGLLECIDDVERNFSFFNPKLLSKWKGPRAWKAQAMAKALKSNKSKENKQLMDDLNLDSDFDIDDDVLPSKAIKSKTNRTRGKGGKDIDQIVKVKWLSKKEIKLLMENHHKSKAMLGPSVLQKWSRSCNIVENKLVGNLEYRFKFLQYLTIVPKCCSEDKDDNNSNSSLPMPEPMDIIDFSDQANTQIFDPVNDDINVGQHENDYLPDSKLDKSYDNDDELATETNTDIDVLKKEISNIIDAECIKVESDRKWSNGLLFSDLLVKLDKTHNGQELSVGMAYVGLLHLANERGLKMIQDGSIINGRRDFYIYRPLMNPAPKLTLTTI